MEKCRDLLQCCHIHHDASGLDSGFQPAAVRSLTVGATCVCRYEQLKLAVKEKDDALNEALELLDQTQKAQKLQEVALDELRSKLAKYSQEISEAQEAIRKRDVAVKLKEEADIAAASAIQSSQLCRQQAASALQQKDFQMQHVSEFRASVPAMHSCI